MNSAIHERARSKAFARIAILNFAIQTDESNLALGRYGGDISIDQFILVAEGNKTELKVWQHIAELIEKSNKTK
tara:strand:+ start:472 stop:693 length:222 start_codon:yes stop_codon:yes gene_type:complete